MASSSPILDHASDLVCVLHTHRDPRRVKLERILTRSGYGYEQQMEYSAYKERYLL